MIIIIIFTFDRQLKLFNCLARFAPGTWSSDEDSKEDSFVEKRSPKEQSEKESSDGLCFPYCNLYS